MNAVVITNQYYYLQSLISTEYNDQIIIKKQDGNILLLNKTASDIYKYLFDSIKYEDVKVSMINLYLQKKYKIDRDLSDDVTNCLLNFIDKGILY